MRLLLTFLVVAAVGLTACGTRSIPPLAVQTDIDLGAVVEGDHDVTVRIVNDGPTARFVVGMATK